MFPPDEIELPPWKADEFDEFAPERNRVLKRILDITQDDEADVRGVVSTYYAMTRFVDDGVGRILHALDNQGLRENTIVVFTQTTSGVAGIVADLRRKGVPGPKAGRPSQQFGSRNKKRVCLGRKVGKGTF